MRSGIFDGSQNYARVRIIYRGSCRGTEVGYVAVHRSELAGVRLVLVLVLVPVPVLGCYLLLVSMGEWNRRNEAVSLSLSLSLSLSESCPTESVGSFRRKTGAAEKGECDLSGILLLLLLLLLIIITLQGCRCG